MDSYPSPMTVCKGTDWKGTTSNTCMLATEPSDTVKQQQAPSSICIYDDISACTLPATMNGHFKLLVLLKEMGCPSKCTVAMVDSGATGNFLNKKYVEKHGVSLSPLAKEMLCTQIVSTAKEEQMGQMHRGFPESPTHKRERR